MNRLNMLGCPPVPAFRKASGGQTKKHLGGRRRRSKSDEGATTSGGARKKKASSEASDSDSLGNFNPYGTQTNDSGEDSASDGGGGGACAVTCRGVDSRTVAVDDAVVVLLDAAAGKAPLKKKKRKARRGDGDLLTEIQEQIAYPLLASRRCRLSVTCPCCVAMGGCCEQTEGFQQMEVVPGLWYQLEDSVWSKRAWHWIGNPLQAWSVLVPLSAVPLSASVRPKAPPPLEILHMAVFPAGVYHSMVRDSNRVLCMVIAPPPHSVGAWYSIDDDDKGEAAAVDVTVSRASTCDPWYTLPPSGPSRTGADGCWIWFPVPPHPAADNTVAVETDAKRHLQQEEESLVLGRWMTETLRGGHLGH